MSENHQTKQTENYQTENHQTNQTYYTVNETAVADQLKRMYLAERERKEIKDEQEKKDLKQNNKCIIV